MTGSWWKQVSGRDLQQGDLLEDCPVPVFRPGANSGESREAPLARQRLIVVTQSCDLARSKVQFVATCAVHTVREFEAVNPEYGKKGVWEEVRKGRRERLHLLSSPVQADDNLAVYVVDFDQVVSLPGEFLGVHAQGLGCRWRLDAPFREHFSQAFARFFMRVGLPEGTDIPKYK